MNNHTILLDIHRNVLASQEGTSSQHQAVSTILPQFTEENKLIISKAQTRSVAVKIIGSPSHVDVCIVFFWENYLPRRREFVSDATM